MKELARIVNELGGYLLVKRGDFDNTINIEVTALPEPFEEGNPLSWRVKRQCVVCCGPNSVVNARILDESIKALTIDVEMAASVEVKR